MRHKLGWALLVTTAIAAIAGCNSGSSGSGGAGSDGSGTGSGGATAEQQAKVVAAFASFQTSGFTRITKTPAPSQHALSPTVVVWVNNDAVAQYRAIDPTDAMGTAGPFPVGTIVIKQGIGADGQPDGNATVASKFPSGFDPSAADWWWGRFAPGGALAESGVIQYCIDCHTSNDLAKTDFLKGTPAANQLP